MDSTGQRNGYITAWAVPEILRRSGIITREADVFAFGMIVIEVGPYGLPPLVLKVEVRLMSEWSLRLL